MKNKITYNVVRQEFNLAVVADFMFPHPHSCDLTKPRKLIRKTSAIEITPIVNNKAFNIKTYDVLLAIIKLWEKLGKPDPRLKFRVSFRQLINEMGLSHGGKVVKEIAKELRCLKTTNINWKESFKVFKNGQYKTIGSIVDMNILSYLRFELDGQNEAQRKESLVEYFTNANRLILQFSDEISYSLLNTSIPLNLAVYNTLGRHQYGKIFYLKINIFIFSRKIKTVPLTATQVLKLLNINLETTKYKHKSHRKVFITKLKDLLHDKTLSQRKYQLDIQIKETKDKKDWLLISKPMLVSTSKEIMLPIINKDKDSINSLALEMTDTIGINLNQYNINFYYMLAKHYQTGFIYRVISEYKELVNLSNKDDLPAYFTTVFHGLVHDSGQKWIKDCGNDCKVKIAQQNRMASNAN